MLWHKKGHKSNGFGLLGGGIHWNRDLGQWSYRMSPAPHRVSRSAVKPTTNSLADYSFPKQKIKKASNQKSRITAAGRPPYKRMPDCAQKFVPSARPNHENRDGQLNNGEGQATCDQAKNRHVQTSISESSLASATGCARGGFSGAEDRGSGSSSKETSTKREPGHRCRSIQSAKVTYSILAIPLGLTDPCVCCCTSVLA